MILDVLPITKVSILSHDEMLVDSDLLSTSIPMNIAVAYFRDIWVVALPALKIDGTPHSFVRSPMCLCQLKSKTPCEKVSVQVFKLFIILVDFLTESNHFLVSLVSVHLGSVRTFRASLMARSVGYSCSVTLRSSFGTVNRQSEYGRGSRSFVHPVASVTARDQSYHRDRTCRASRSQWRRNST